MSKNKPIEQLPSCVDSSVLCWLATADKEGMPNVSPKEIFAAYGDNALVIADIASPNSVRNIRVNPQVCVSMIDVFKQKGLKIKGKASIIDKKDQDFAKVGESLLLMAGSTFPIRHIIHIEISSVAEILAPSYLLCPEQSDSERLQSAYQNYKVKPIDI